MCKCRGQRDEFSLKAFKISYDIEVIIKHGENLNTAITLIASITNYTSQSYNELNID